MASSNEVKSLKAIVIEEVIFSELINCVSSEQSVLDRAKTVADVRQKLEEYLVGEAYGPVRWELVKKFCTTQFDWKTLHLVLDCLLDAFFIKLPDKELLLDTLKADADQHAVDLIRTVVDRCPNLKHFSLTGYCQNCPVLEMQEPLLPTLFAKWSNLTVLDIQFCCPSKDSDCLDFYSSLGQSCPNLNKLILGNKWKILTIKQLLAFLIGEGADVLFMPKDIHRVQFYQEHIMFKNLKHLEVGFSPNVPLLALSSRMAFFLRHLPLLEHFDDSTQLIDEGYIPLAISLLIEDYGPPQETVVKTGVNCFKFILNPPPPGKELISKLLLSFFQNNH